MGNFRMGGNSSVCKYSSVHYNVTRLLCAHEIETIITVIVTNISRNLGWKKNALHGSTSIPMHEWHRETLECNNNTYSLHVVGATTLDVIGVRRHHASFVIIVVICRFKHYIIMY